MISQERAKEGKGMKVTCIGWPHNRELMLFKRAIWVTMGKTEAPKRLPSDELLRGALEARHSPVRLLTFTFLIEGIPGNTSVHLCRHVHALPFVSSLRNDRQDRIDGDAARRDTPVDMIYHVNAEELMTIANKRLCRKAAEKTREAVWLMCKEAERYLPQLSGLLVPMCDWCGGVCHEIDGCGRRPAARPDIG